MSNSIRMPDAEIMLRAYLLHAANQAPEYVPDLERTLVRRRMAAKHRRRVVGLVGGTAVAVVAAIGLVLAQQGPGVGRVAEAAPPIARMAPPMPVDPLNCPASVAGFIAPATHESIGTALVPGTPSNVHACSYSADVIGRTKYESYLVGPELLPLVTELNAMKADQGQCTPGSSASVLLRFGYATGDEVDVIVTVSSNCTTTSNGVLTRWSAAPITVPLLGQTEMSQEVGVASTTPPPGSVAPTHAPKQGGLPVTTDTNDQLPTTTSLTSNSK